MFSFSYYKYSGLSKESEKSNLDEFVIHQIEYILNPNEYGYSFIDNQDLKGKDPDYNAKIFLDLLEGPNNSFQKIVELNAGATIYLAGLTKDLKEGFKLAKQTIVSKKSKKYFENLLKSQ